MPKEGGTITVSDPGSDRPLMIQKTYQCCHCGGHFESAPNLSTKLIQRMTQDVTDAELTKLAERPVRGYCSRCNGYVCGPGCAECVPQELMVENMEKGRPWNFRPTVVAVEDQNKLIIP